jgi:hypothetical protein
VDNYVENSIPMPANPEKSSLPPNCPSAEHTISFNQIKDLAEAPWRVDVALQQGVRDSSPLGFCA